MEAVNGVSEGGPPPPSPLTGCYLLIIIGEPHSQDHKDIILRRVSKGLLSWDLTHCLVDLEKELAIITEQAPDGEEARYGERLIQYASENLVTEILIHPAVSTLSQCVRNLLSSFTRHRHIIHSGYTFSANGSWALQDGTFSLADFSEAFQELEVQRVIRAYENSITVDIHCAPEGDWTRLPKESFAKNCKVRLNPVDMLPQGSPSISNFLNYITPFLIPLDIETALESSEVVGNIRFSHPTLYVFPGGQGDAALFGINGFNMLLDGGFSRKACFWDFVRHLDRLDAVLLTRLNNSNVSGISSVLRRKRQNAVYPQIGHFFCNIQERKALLSPDGDKDKDPLLINLLDEGHEIVTNLKQLNLAPQSCYRDSEPINLYHKVGHGTLDMYVLSPAKESKEVREFLQKWNNNDHKLFSNVKSGKEFSFPLPNLVSICALLVWQPSNPNDSITRILFPGSTPQNKIFEGLDRLRQLECIKYPVCSEKSLTPVPVKKTKESVLDKIIPAEKTQKIFSDIKKEKSPRISDNKLNKDSNLTKNGTENGDSDTKTFKKSDSTDSDKSIPNKPDEKPVNGKADDKPKKPEPKSKIDSKPPIRKTEPSKPIDRKPKPIEKKASPTTPKKILNGDSKDTPAKPKSKFSPSSTPAKSTKEANNRKVFESKNKPAPKKDLPKVAPEKKDAKPERKPISRRPKATPPPATAKSAASPIKKVQKPDSISKKIKLDKEGTTDSSTVSTPSAEQEIKRDLSKLTPEEIDQIKAQELADLQEEQEVVQEIEAVFRKGEVKKDVDESEMRKIKNISIEEKTDEEYLIVEKVTLEPDIPEVKEDETQKHTRDSEESEKQRKLSAEMIKAEDKPKATPITSPEDKIDSDKKVEDAANALESQPDEKFSATVESGATTAPTLPEDERIPLDEIKEDQVIEEKHVKEDTKEKEIPTIQLPAKTFEPVPKIPPVVGIRLDKQTHIRDIVKTPDEVADLPMHEVADHYVEYQDELKSPRGQAEKKLEVHTAIVVKEALDEVVKEELNEKLVAESKQEKTEVAFQKEIIKTVDESKEEIKAIVDEIIEESKEIVSDEQKVSSDELSPEKDNELEDIKKSVKVEKVTDDLVVQTEHAEKHVTEEHMDKEMVDDKESTDEIDEKQTAKLDDDIKSEIKHDKESSKEEDMVQDIANIETIITSKQVDLIEAEIGVEHLSKKEEKTDDKDEKDIESLGDKIASDIVSTTTTVLTTKKVDEIETTINISESKVTTTEVTDAGILEIETAASKQAAEELEILTRERIERELLEELQRIEGLKNNAESDIDDKAVDDKKESKKDVDIQESIAATKVVEVQADSKISHEIETDKFETEDELEEARSGADIKEDNKIITQQDDVDKQHPKETQKELEEELKHGDNKKDDTSVTHEDDVDKHDSKATSEKLEDTKEDAIIITHEDDVDKHGSKSTSEKLGDTKEDNKITPHKDDVSKHDSKVTQGEEERAMSPADTNEVKKITTHEDDTDKQDSKATLKEAVSPTDTDKVITHKDDIDKQDTKETKADLEEAVSTAEAKDVEKVITHKDDDDKHFINETQEMESSVEAKEDKMISHIDDADKHETHVELERADIKEADKTTIQDDGILKHDSKETQGELEETLSEIKDSNIASKIIDEVKDVKETLPTGDKLPAVEDITMKEVFTEDKQFEATATQDDVCEIKGLSEDTNKTQSPKHETLSEKVLTDKDDTTETEQEIIDKRYKAQMSIEESLQNAEKSKDDLKKDMSDLAGKVDVSLEEMKEETHDVATKRDSIQETDITNVHKLVLDDTTKTEETIVESLKKTDELKKDVVDESETIDESESVKELEAKIVDKRIKAQESIEESLKHAEISKDELKKEMADLAEKIDVSLAEANEEIESQKEIADKRIKAQESIEESLQKADLKKDMADLAIDESLAEVNEESDVVDKRLKAQESIEESLRALDKTDLKKDMTSFVAESLTEMNEETDEDISIADKRIKAQESIEEALKTDLKQDMADLADKVGHSLTEANEDIESPTEIEEVVDKRIKAQESIEVALKSDLKKDIADLTDKAGGSLVEENEDIDSQTKDSVDEKVIHTIEDLDGDLSKTNKSDEAATTIDELKTTVQDFLKETKDDLQHELQEEKAAVGNIVQDITDTKDDFKETITSKMDETKSILEDVAKTDLEASVVSKLEDVKTIMEDSKEILENKVEDAKTIVEDTKEALESKVEDVKITSEDIKEVLVEKAADVTIAADDIKEAIKNKVDDIKEALENKLDDLKEDSQQKIDQVEIATESLASKVDDIKNDSQEKIEDIKLVTADLADKVMMATEDIKESLASKIDVIKEESQDKIEHAKTLTEDIKMTLETKADDFKKDLVEDVSNATEDVTESLVSKVADIKEDLQEKSEEIKVATEKIKESLSGKVDSVKEESQKKVEDVKLATEDMKETIVSKVDDVKDALQTKIDGEITTAADLLKSKTDEVELVAEDTKLALEEAVQSKLEDTKLLAEDTQEVLEDKIKDLQLAAKDVKDEDVTNTEESKMEIVEQIKEKDGQVIEESIAKDVESLSNQIKEDISGLKKDHVEELITKLDTTKEEIGSSIKSLKEDAEDIGSKVTDVKEDVKPAVTTVLEDVKAVASGIEEAAIKIKGAVEDIKSDSTKTDINLDLKTCLESSLETVTATAEEPKSVDIEIQSFASPTHAETVTVKDSSPDSPTIAVCTLPPFTESDLIDKADLGRKSPKEREHDVAKIVASVAEVLKSEAPLEEFKGKIPLEITSFTTFSSYTTELRETHITTVDSPTGELPGHISPIKEEVIEQTIEEEDEDEHDKDSNSNNTTKISDLIKNSNDLLEATSKMISDIKSARTSDCDDDKQDPGTVTRMLVTASSEDGGEETVICPAGSIKFSKSGESSGRTSPDSTKKSETESDKLAEVDVAKKSPSESSRSTPDHKKSSPESDKLSEISSKMDDDKTESVSTEIEQDKPVTDGFDNKNITDDNTSSRKESVDAAVTSGSRTPEVSEKMLSEDIPEKKDKLELDTASIKSQEDIDDVEEELEFTEKHETEELANEKIGKDIPSSPNKIASGKTTPVSGKIESDTTHDVKVSGKSTPELRKQSDADKISLHESSLLSGKSTPSEKTTFDSKSEIAFSGKSTPDKFEASDIEVASGKSTPDIKSSTHLSDQSGKATPDIIDKTSSVIKDLASGKFTPLVDDGKSSRTSTPDVTGHKIESGKSTPDLQRKLSTTSEVEPVVSGKTTPDVNEADLRKLSVDQVQSGKMTPTEVASGKSTPDVKDMSKSGKSTPDIELITGKTTPSGKSTPDIKDSELTKISGSGKSTPDVGVITTDTKEVDGRKVSVDQVQSDKATPDLSGKSTPVQEAEVRKLSVDQGQSGKATPVGDLSGKSTPVPEEEVRKSSIDKISTGKSTPVGNLSGKSTPVQEDRKLSVDTIHTGKSSPVGDLSGKSTPVQEEELRKLSADQPQTGKSTPVDDLSGKTTPLQEDRTLSVDKIHTGKSSPVCDLSGKSTPVQEEDLRKLSVDQMQTEESTTVGDLSGKSTPVQEDRKLSIDKIHTGKSSPVGDLSGKSTPVPEEEVRKLSLDKTLSGKSTPDIKQVDEQRKMSVDQMASGKTTPDQRKSVELSTSGKTTPASDIVVSGKSTPDVKETIDKAQSGKSTPDLKESERKLSVSGKDTHIDKQESIPSVTSGPDKDASTSDIGKASKSTEELPDDISKLKSAHMLKELMEESIQSTFGVTMNGDVLHNGCDGISPLEETKQPDEHSGKTTPEPKDSRKSSDSRKFSITSETTKTSSVHSGKSSPDIKEDMSSRKSSIVSGTYILETQQVITSDEPCVKRTVQDFIDAERSLPGKSGDIAGPSIDNLSGKSTPDIADIEKIKELQEIRTHEKHIPGSSTPPTVPVSPIIKEMPTQSEIDLTKSFHADIESDDEIPGSPTSMTSAYEFGAAKKMDPMNTSFYGSLPSEEPEVDIKTAIQEHEEARGESLTQTQQDLMMSSFIGSELPSSSATPKEDKKDPIESWGKPLGLPSPAPPNDNKGTPKKERKLPSNVSVKNKLNDDRKRSESPKKQRKVNPVYVDLTYVPHHGNSYYTYVDFFKRVRARYYVFSGIEPSKEVYNALLEAKQLWEDKELEVTIIPTYDTDVLGYWVAENEELLTKHKIDLSPSASRCTINLQDHETSCSAYRLEF